MLVPRKFPFGAELVTKGEMTQHGHLVRTWNNVNSGGPKVFDTSWVNYPHSQYFQVSGSWGTYNNQAPQLGLGDPAGTTDSFGGNQPHNTIQPVYGVYKFRRIK